MTTSEAPEIHRPPEGPTVKPTANRPPTGTLNRLRGDWRMGTTAAIASAAVFGIVGGLLTPRGPITTTEAIVAMAAALAVGIGGGLVMGSRWVMLVMPVVYIGVFELTRIGMVGPTVDAIQLGSFYGLVAFVLGRVFHGVLVLVPMLVGTGYGRWLATRAGHPEARLGVPGRTLTALGTVVLVALAILIAWPASTAPILGSDGEPPADSIAELATIPIGGHDQVLMIRGRDVDNPVLLYLTGGPGGTDIGAVRRDTSLEEAFTVVVWEQRGAGKSYSALDPTDTFTLDQLVADTLEVTEYLRDRFDQPKIFLVGQSWGSTLGVLTVQQRPELYQALVGVGQMVSQRETDILFWEDTLAWAEETANTELAATLRSNGPPPYEELTLYDPVVSHEHSWNLYPEMDLSNEMPSILFVPEYTFMDRVNAFRGFLDTNGTLYPQLQTIDFRRDAPQLEVPYYMILGEHEARGRAVLAEEWFEMVEAPFKERIIFEGGGHRAHFDRPGEFADVMTRVLEGAG